MTPGREEDVEEDEIRLYTKDDYNKKVEGDKAGNTKQVVETENKGLQLARGIVEALGGKENILDVDNCISRLRIVLADPTKMKSDDVFKKQLEAMGVIHMGDAVQIVYGPAVAAVAVDVREVLGID